MSSILNDLPEHISEIEKMYQIQAKAIKQGFKWPSADAVLQKCQEELDEVNEAISLGEFDSIEDEVGDLLFTSLLLCQYLDKDLNKIAQRSNLKFAKRYDHAHAHIRERYEGFEDAPMSEILKSWQVAKKAEA